MVPCVLWVFSFNRATTYQYEGPQLPPSLSLLCCSIKLSTTAISFTVWLRAGGVERIWLCNELQRRDRNEKWGRAVCAVVGEQRMLNLHDAAPKGSVCNHSHLGPVITLYLFYSSLDRLLIPLHRQSRQPAFTSSHDHPWSRKRC